MPSNAIGAGRFHRLNAGHCANVLMASDWKVWTVATNILLESSVFECFEQSERHRYCRPRLTNFQSVHKPPGDGWLLQRAMPNKKKAR